MIFRERRKAKSGKFAKLGLQTDETMGKGKFIDEILEFCEQHYPAYFYHRLSGGNVTSANVTAHIPNLPNGLS